MTLIYGIILKFGSFRVWDLPSDSPNSSVGRYFPVQAECSPAPGPGSSECSRSPGAGPLCPPAKEPERPLMDILVQMIFLRRVQSECGPGSADALSAPCCRWAGLGPGCPRWTEGAGRRPAGRGSSSGLSSASSPRQNLCGPPGRQDKSPNLSNSLQVAN